MAKSSLYLVEYAEAHVGDAYVYGCFGQIGNAKLYEAKLRQYPAQIGKWPKSTYEKDYGKRWYDCIGLIKAASWSETPTSNPVYNASQDVNANRLIELCKEQGAYSSIPNIPGLIVWKSGHVGVWKGDGKTVIEAKGHMYGVVKTTDTKWLKWGKCPWFEYAEQPSPAPEKKSYISIDLPVLRYGDKSEDLKGYVQALQIMLNGRGFRDDNWEKLAVDGSYGRKTEQAVRRMQAACGLVVDGICGKASWSKLCSMVK